LQLSPWSASFICPNQKLPAIHRFASFSFLRKARVYCKQIATAPADAAAMLQMENRQMCVIVSTEKADIR